jgi:hypothetical protein
MSAAPELGAMVEKTITLGEKEVDSQSGDIERSELVKDWTDEEEARARHKYVYLQLGSPNALSVQPCCPRCPAGRSLYWKERWRPLFAFRDVSSQTEHSANS